MESSADLEVQPRSRSPRTGASVSGDVISGFVALVTEGRLKGKRRFIDVTHAPKQASLFGTSTQGTIGKGPSGFLHFFF